jgi:hypothetical protein
MFSKERKMKIANAQYATFESLLRCMEQIKMNLKYLVLALLKTRINLHTRRM